MCIYIDFTYIHTPDDNHKLKIYNRNTYTKRKESKLMLKTVIKLQENRTKNKRR